MLLSSENWYHIVLLCRIARMLQLLDEGPAQCSLVVKIGLEQFEYRRLRVRSDMFNEPRVLRRQWWEIAFGCRHYIVCHDHRGLWDCSWILRGSVSVARVRLKR
jgi:hypothetical protein